MKSSKHHVYGLITVLFFIGFGLFFYRMFILDVPLTEEKTVTSWMIEANLRFKADHNTAVKAYFTIPYSPPYFAILDEYFVSHNYGVSTNLNGFNRQAVWSLRRAIGPQSLYYRAILRETNHDEFSLGIPPRVKINPLPENQRFAADTIIHLVRQSSADIQTFAQGVIQELNKKDGSAKLLTGSDFNNEDKITQAAILILNQAKVYALPVKGVYLNQTIKAEFKSFLGVYNGNKWLYINPKTGSVGLPKNFLVWQYGGDPLYNLASGGKNSSFNLTISPTPINALMIAKARGLQTDSQMLRFSLLQLPINVQENYKILLTVPIGAFIILLLRNFVGLKTFGTFMPVLIALAFRETHIALGVTLFILIISVGLLVRFYLDQLQLLLVPRLAAILTVVILLMVFISVISQNLNLDAGLSVALFPMVILTMTIERMCILWDERGPGDAVKSGVGSLIAAILAFLAMNYSPLQYLFFAFPELLLVLLALTLWFGQYRGYRFFELRRFKALVQEK